MVEVSSSTQRCLYSPYFIMYNTNQVYGNSPYYNNYNYQGINQMPQYQQIPTNQNFRGVQTLQGKIIDNLEVVKATDIPLDGSISYFPLADGTGIASKQLMQDGTSKIVIYRPSNDDNVPQETKYVTENDLKEQIKGLNSKDIKDIKEDIKTLKRQIEDITDEIKDKKEK